MIQIQRDAKREGKASVLVMAIGRIKGFVVKGKTAAPQIVATKAVLLR
jgi:hypothetical protein